MRDQHCRFISVARFRPDALPVRVYPVQRLFGRGERINAVVHAPAGEVDFEAVASGIRIEADPTNGSLSFHRDILAKLAPTVSAKVQAREPSQ